MIQAVTPPTPSAEVTPEGRTVASDTAIATQHLRAPRRRPPVVGLHQDVEAPRIIVRRAYLYEYGLPHAGLGSLPDMSTLEVEHVFLDEDDEERGRRARANAKIFEVTWVTFGAGSNIRVCEN